MHAALGRLYKANYKGRLGLKQDPNWGNKTMYDAYTKYIYIHIYIYIL
jgi:hypothetical protein